MKVAHKTYTFHSITNQKSSDFIVLLKLIVIE